MKNGKQVHIVKNPVSGWDVKQSGSQTVLAHTQTQQSAVDTGRAYSQAIQGELVIHRPSGQIRARDSHGNDRHPPKG